MTITVITRCFSSELRDCRSENDCLLCVCMRRAYGPLYLPLPVRSLAHHESTASTYAVLVVKRARGRESGTARESASARIRKSQRQRERTHRRSFVNTTRLLTIYRIVPRDCCETARQSERERASKRERARESGRERVNDTHPCRLCCRRHRHRHRSSKRRDA